MFDFGLTSAEPTHPFTPGDGGYLWAASYHPQFVCGCTAIAAGVDDTVSFVRCRFHTAVRDGGIAFDFGLESVTECNGIYRACFPCGCESWCAGPTDSIVTDRCAAHREHATRLRWQLQPTTLANPGPPPPAPRTDDDATTCGECGEETRDCQCVECQDCDRRGSESDIGFCCDCQRCDDCCGAPTCQGCETRNHDHRLCARCDCCGECCECAHCNRCGDPCENTCGDCDRGECCGCRCENDDDDDENDGYENPRRPTFHDSSKTERKHNPSPRFIAVEIEVAKSRKDAMYAVCSAWRCAIVGDGSLPPGGFEINTAPAGGDKYVEQIEEICEALRRDDARITSDCGLHVHVDARDFTYYDIRRLVLLYEQIEPALFATQPQSRQENRFCMPCGEKYANQLRNALRPKENKAAFFGAVYGADKGELRRGKGKKRYAGDKYNHERYHALNLHSWIYRGTVECRMHAGTVNAEKIIAWGMLWAGLLDYAMRMPENEIKKLKLRTMTQKQAFLLMTATGDNVRAYLKERWTRFSAYPVE